MIQDYFKYAFKSITHKGARSYLTMIGIFIGIAAVVSLISLGQGLQDTVSSQFEAMGYDIIMVMPGAGLSSMGGTSSPLTEEDVDVIRDVRGVDLAAGMVSKIAKLEYGNEIKYTWASGIPTGKDMKLIEDMQSIRIREGRKFYDGDKYAAIVGIRVAEGKLFNHHVKVGDKIKINNQQFRVVGNLESIGNNQDDESLFIPLDTAKELFNESNYMVVLARSKGGEEPSEVAEDIKKKLRRSRDLEKGEEDFTVQTSEQLLETYSSVLGVIQWVLIGIAAISLIVGGVGIMNTMYTSVLEKTKEIGVMKAVGARNSDIQLLFLIESGMLGMAGGIVGCLIGLGLSKVIELASKEAIGSDILHAYISPELILGALAFSFTVGCLSGLLPARQAASLKPVDSLRYE